MTSLWCLLIKGLGAESFGADGLVIIQPFYSKSRALSVVSVPRSASRRSQQSMYPLIHQSERRYLGCGFAALCSFAPLRLICSCFYSWFSFVIFCKTSPSFLCGFPCSWLFVCGSAALCLCENERKYSQT